MKKPKVYKELDKVRENFPRSPNIADQIPRPEAPPVKMPTRADLFGKPGEPLGTCMKCKKQFPINQLQKIYLDPQSAYWVCGKCGFKKRMREKFSGSLFK